MKMHADRTRLEFNPNYKILQPTANTQRQARPPAWTQPQQRVRGQRAHLQRQPGRQKQDGHSERQPSDA